MEIEGVDWVEKIDIHAQQGAKPNEDGDLNTGFKDSYSLFRRTFHRNPEKRR